jgi:hypothetical protein
MLILLSQNEQGISALDLQKHIFPSGGSSMKSMFPWMQRHYVNYYKGEQLYETNRRETALTHPRCRSLSQNKYYIYHGSYELTYLNQRIRRMS